MTAALHQLAKMTPWGEPDKAVLPKMDPKQGSELIRFEWKKIDPKVEMKDLPPMLQALLTSAIMVSDMSVKILLTTKQAIANDLGKQWAEDGFFKTKAGADVAQKWAQGASTISMVLPFASGYLVDALKPMQDLAHPVREFFGPLGTQVARIPLLGESIQGTISGGLNLIPDFGNGKVKSDLSGQLKSVGPSISNFGMQEGQIHTQKAGADNQYSQFNTQRTEAEKQQASQTKSELQQQLQGWQQFAQGLIESLHRTLEKIMSAA